MSVAGPIVQRLALAMTGYFRESGAENYIEMGLNARTEPFERYVVTVQKYGALSPHQARLAAEAARDTLASDLAESRAEVARLAAALGCHLNADAYRESFPDNDQDAVHNRKSETWWRLMARCAVPQDDPLHEICSVAALSMPEVVAHRDAVIAKVTEEHGA